MFRRRERECQSPEELFAVAAIAFCLRHDEMFRRHFLHKLCGFDKIEAETKVEVEADTHKWGDLVIKSKDTSFVCVLEFKIGSDVQPHQNPNSPDFKYGKCISQEYNYCKKKCFIVLTKKEKLKDIKCDCRQRNDLQCSWKSWDDINLIEPNSGMIKDLFESLGDIGIEIFRERQLKNMNLTSLAMGSKKVTQALDSIYKNLFNKKLVIQRIDDEGGADDCWNTGVHIPQNLSADFEGWFGFEGIKQANQTVPESNCAVVYFYCHASQDKENRLIKLLKDKGFKTENVDSWDKATICNVVVRNYVGNDLSWFESVYRAVGAIK